MPTDSKAADAKATTAKPKIDYEELAQSYSYSYAFLTHTPELKTIFEQAVKDGWTAPKFQAAVRNTQWFKQYNERARLNQALRYTDPAEFKRRWNQRNGEIRALAGTAGANLSDKQLVQMTDHALDGDWTNDEVARNIAVTNDWEKSLGDKSTPSGMAAQYDADIRKQGAAYGVNVSNHFVAQRVENILTGKETEDFYKQYFQQAAKQSYPGYVDQINAGLTMADVAEPYKQAMAQTLELNPDELDLKDDTIKKALQNIDPATGKPSMVPLYKFEQGLRDDSRWQYTDNAKETYRGIAAQLGKMFGRV